ncbi:MAG: Tol-Pal system beta propeller repeat protein TolB [Candidatus Hydrogenedentes bacterium]|nr:Tol-Pal system beta propeller repeat protein TolB [Candidatus Hydrogenedentota bacterium]
MNVSYFGWIVSAFCILNTAAYAAGPVVFDVSGQGKDHRTPVAVPAFAAVAGQESVAKMMSDVIAYDLDFSGECKILDKEGYPPSFKGYTPDATQVDCAPWKAIGVEHLVYAYITQEGSNIVAECRLFDVHTGQQVVGKKLQAGTEWARLVAHQFSDIIIERLTGTPGIATSRICFTNGVTGKKEICIADYDGANMKQLTQHNSISILPKFSRDGSRLAYVSYKDHFPYLYVLEITSGKSAVVSKKSGLNVSPSWAPDGKSLAMVLSKDTNNEIYVRSLVGDEYTRLTNSKGTDTSPSFSPDGSQMAFVTDREGSEQIFVMNRDGSNQHRISFQGGRSYDPAWSPDGKHIAYVVDKGGQQIYVSTVDGNDYQQVTRAAGNAEGPSWSPDSRHIIYANSSSLQLWTVTLSTGAEQKIPNIAVACQGPDWARRPAQ